jgi:IMP dehydrogenase
MITILPTAFTYLDVLLVPQHSKIDSRSQVSTTVHINDFEFKHPIIPANMKSIMGKDMASEIIKSGGLVCYHRFNGIEEQLSTFLELGSNNFAISIGVNGEEIDNVKRFVDVGGKIICLDIAHADSKHALDMVRTLRSAHRGLLIIAGNVATKSGAERLWNAGADVVKVGIGSSGICSTRINAGAGFPQLSALIDVYDYLEDTGIKDKYIIADGGISEPGSIVKALTRSHMVMVGNLFSACIETPGYVFNGKDIGLDERCQYKMYVGSSTHKDKYIEGVRSYVKCKGNFADVLERNLQGLRSGCSYQGVDNLVDLRESPIFVQLSNAGIKESGIHSVDKVIS